MCKTIPNKLSSEQCEKTAYPNPFAQDIFNILSATYPSTQIELNYVNEFTLLVAIVLSAQTTDVAVNKATASLFPTFFTPQAMLQLGEEALKKTIKSIGLYNSKAKNIIALCKQLIKENKGKIPSDFSSLIKLPGVGRKTANVFLNVAHDKPTIAVDTHVFRVCNRLGLTKAKNPLQSELQLIKIIPSHYQKPAHILLILHGRRICKAIKPLCSSCPVKSYCWYACLNLVN